MSATPDGVRPALLWPSSRVLLLVTLLPAAWFLYGLLPRPETADDRGLRRLCGYGAAAALLVPGLHIGRRWFRSRSWGSTAAWMRWHIGASYAAFLLTLVHSHGHAHRWITGLILGLFWLVTISGIVGFYGQKLLYRVLALSVEKEYGLERLETERQRLLVVARGERKNIVDAASAVARFADAVLEELEREFPPWSWLFSREALEPAGKRNAYLQTRDLTGEKQAQVLDKLRDLAEARRQRNVEFWFHRLGRVWLLVHGPAAVALWLLVGEHVAMSWRYSGL